MTSFVTGNLLKVVNPNRSNYPRKINAGSNVDVVVALATIVGLVGALLGAHWDSKVSKKWMMTPAGAWFDCGNGTRLLFGHFGEI